MGMIDEISCRIQMMCGNSMLKWFEFGLLIGILLMVILLPLTLFIEWKWYCKKYGEETVREIWKRL